MSILIKGQSLPKDGEHLLLQIKSDGTIYDALGRRIASVAVELPPHGRLIDADAQIERAKRLNLSTVGIITQLLESAPTIIEAEGEE